MKMRLNFLINRLSEKLWVKPLLMCAISVVAVFTAGITDSIRFADYLPDMPAQSIGTLLQVLASSMLVIATFAVASMVSAYSSASSTATPRAFRLIVADDVSQNALSMFIGAFIFSIVALSALNYGYYGQAGRFTLFSLTVLVFALVILTFVRWVDRIARLGRMENSIDKVEEAADRALQQRRRTPRLECRAPDRRPEHAVPVYGERVGYIQRIELAALQDCAENDHLQIEVVSQAGRFIAPGRVLAWVWADEEGTGNPDLEKIANAFLLGDSRTYDEDPRFGLVVLSEIGSRALSPAVNDPGTAIDVIHTLVRLLNAWNQPLDDEAETSVRFDRVALEELSPADLFEDAFRSIARDGAGTIEVVVRLIKGLHALARTSNPAVREQALEHASQALARAELALEFEADRAAARSAAQRADEGLAA